MKQKYVTFKKPSWSGVLPLMWAETGRHNTLWRSKWGDPVATLLAELVKILIIKDDNYRLLYSRPISSAFPSKDATLTCNTRICIHNLHSPTAYKSHYILITLWESLHIVLYQCFSSDSPFHGLCFIFAPQMRGDEALPTGAPHESGSLWNGVNAD